MSEYCTKGNFLQKILDKKCLRDELILILKDIVSALVYLHKNNIIHKDIRPQNILIDDQGKAKLTDFCMQKILQTFGIFMNTPAYNAPELFSPQPCYSTVSDVYAVGCLLWQIDSRVESPWMGLKPNEIRNALLNQKKTLQPSPYCPKDLRNLIIKCVQHDHNQRPTMLQVLGAIDVIIKKLKKKAIIQPNLKMDSPYQVSQNFNNSHNNPYVEQNLKDNVEISNQLMKSKLSSKKFVNESLNDIESYLQNMISHFLKYNNHNDLMKSLRNIEPKEYSLLAKTMIEIAIDSSKSDRSKITSLIITLNDILSKWDESVELG